MQPRKHKIRWLNLDRETEVLEGQTILDSALEHGVPLEHACGGFCACTTCHIHVKAGAANVSTIDEDEMDRLECKEGRTSESRLSCQSKIYGDIAIEIP